MFVEFVSCKECNSIFKSFPSEEIKEHYESRKRIKRCLGCEKIEKYNNQFKKQEGR